MTDYTQDTPCMARTYCPTCEPEADPTKEILDVRYCNNHEVSREGLDDSGLDSPPFMSGSADVTGVSNKIWCDLLHRKEVTGT